MQILATFNASNDVSISKRTFDRYRRRMGFSRGPSVKKQVLQPRHRRIRLEWCKPRRFWTVDDHWSRVIFSDESMIKVGDNYRVYVWKRKGEGYRPDLYGEKKNSVKSRFKVMVWGCITRYGIGTLSFVDGREILGYTRGEFVASYCATFSYVWRNISRRWGIRLTSSRLGKERTELTLSRGPPIAQILTPLKIVGQLSRQNYSSMFWRLSRK